MRASYSARRWLVHRTLPAVYLPAMGSEMYLTRHTDEADLHEAVRRLQQRASG